MNQSFLGFLLLLACLAALLPFAARPETPMGVTSLAEARTLYQHDVQACRSGAVPEDRRTCLKEAERAYAEARREAMQHGRPRAQQARKAQ
jgi:hypothetical protein